MELPEIAKARAAFHEIRSPSERETLASDLTARLTADLDLLGSRQNAAAEEFRRLFQRWHADSPTMPEDPCTVLEDLRISRVYRAGAVAAGLLAWILQVILFQASFEFRAWLNIAVPSIITPCLIVAVGSAVYVAIAGAPRPHSVIKRLRNVLMLPAFGGLLTAVGIILFFRAATVAVEYASALIGISWGVASISATILSALLYGLAQTYAWSNRMERGYRTILSADAATRSFLHELDRVMPPETGADVEAGARAGIIIRIDKTGFGILQEEHSGLRYPFTFDKVRGFHGQEIEQAGLGVGATVRFRSKGSRVTSLEAVPQK